jgi:hypothetical protein
MSPSTNRLGAEEIEHNWTLPATSAQLKDRKQSDLKVSLKIAARDAVE